MPEPNSIAHVALDGVVDSATVAVGLLAALGKVWWRYTKGIANSLTAVGADFLNGTVVTPFCLMIGAVFSTTILQYLRSTSPVSTSIAGAIGLFFVISELRK